MNDFKRALSTAAQCTSLRKVDTHQVDTISKAADPGKLKDERKWPEWYPTFVNYLSMIPGVYGVPLSYDVRENQAPDHTRDVEGDFTEEIIACAPLNGPKFRADAHKVHQLLKNFLMAESAERCLFFDPRHPDNDERAFSSYEWYDFYHDAKEQVPNDMPPPPPPPPTGHSVSTHCFVDADHASNTVTRRSQTGILIFLNRAPIVWYSKRQNTVETSTFGREFIAMRTAVEHSDTLRYKLRMFGIPIEGPTNVFCDNEAVFKNTTIPESTLKKKHNSICYHRCREAVAAKVMRVAKEDMLTNLADLFTKPLVQSVREGLLDHFTY